MRNLIAATFLALLASATPLAAADCARQQTAVNVERVVEIDGSGGPLFGALTKEDREPSFLRDKEVVLTFDDGPSPWVTPKILDTLEKHCTRATFFSVGRMAVAYPDVARDIIARGHTLGGHTWSHPRRLPKLAPAKAQDQIERGFAALEAATGGGVAPFFRFTGLNDSAALLTYLQGRGVASFTVDVVSDDSFISDPEKLTRITLARLRARGRGILLFHDIKPTTAKALPAILDGLKAEGYKVVHLRNTKQYQPKSELVEGFRGQVAEKLAKSRKTPRLMPFYGAISELRDDERQSVVGKKLPVTLVAPAPRERKEREKKKHAASGKLKPSKTKKSKPQKAVPPKPPVDEGEVLPWKTEVGPPANLRSSIKSDATPQDGDSGYRGASTVQGPPPYLR
jgi:peptidoglycan/xylan/chitin deacetylase (PgdA/CDA1 family)